MIGSFTGQYAFLSNFYPVYVVLDGEQYPTVEHAYQAAKTVVPADRARIRALGKPGAAKQAGRRIGLRNDWESMKESVMRELLEQKFAHSDLRQALLRTGDAELVEGNWWNDTYWGVCRGKGRNRLGILLMELRAEAQGGTT